MADKVYKMWMARLTAAGYELSEAEQNELMAKNNANLEELGVKTLDLGDSTWSSEHWLFFGLEEYPDMAAVQAHAAYLMEINWFKYTEAKILLGTEWQPS